MAFCLSQIASCHMLTLMAPAITRTGVKLLTQPIRGQ